MRHRGFLVGLVVCGQALAGPLGTGFVDGSIRASGFPDPLRQNTLLPVGVKSGSGGGSTGGGFGGFSNASVGIIDSDESSSISLSGLAFHNINDGYTASYAATPLMLALTKPTRYSINENSTVDGAARSLVTFEAVTGSITTFVPGSGMLSAGSYRVRFGVAGGRPNGFGTSVVSEWYAPSGNSRIGGSSLDWKLTLRPILPSYSLGNFAPATQYFVQGQSFTPSSFGNTWTPPEPTSTPTVARLQTFTFAFDFAFSVPPPVLYIFDAPPTPAAAASGTGSRASGVHIGGGTYSFPSVALDFRTKYYAVLPEPAVIFDGGGDPYPGGVDMFIRSDLNPIIIGEGYGTFDTGFSAEFDFVPGCAADLNRDALVDDADFVLFARAYNVLECLDPAMPADCPANLNNDLFVDDDDFVRFAIAYDTLVCP